MGHWASLGFRVACATALAWSAAAGADNPIIQTRFTADPAPMVHDGVVYLYAGHDEDDADGFKMRDWRRDRDAGFLPPVQGSLRRFASRRRLLALYAFYLVGRIMSALGRCRTAGLCKLMNETAQVCR